MIDGSVFLLGCACGAAVLYVFLDLFGINFSRYPAKGDVQDLRRLIQRATIALTRAAQRQRGAPWGVPWGVPWAADLGTRTAVDWPVPARPKLPDAVCDGERGAGPADCV